MLYCKVDQSPDDLSLVHISSSQHNSNQQTAAMSGKGAKGLSGKGAKG
jgi:hypothetical protein